MHQTLNLDAESARPSDNSTPLLGKLFTQKPRVVQAAFRTYTKRED